MAWAQFLRKVDVLVRPKYDGRMQPIAAIKQSRFIAAMLGCFSTQQERGATLPKAARKAEGSAIQTEVHRAVV